MPTHRMIDYETGDSFIIPEIIYGMYDATTDTLYLNPGYNLKYNPDGLSYDQEVANNLKFCSKQWYDFMESRIRIPYERLKKIDAREKTFKEVCRYYGIERDNPNLLSTLLESFRHRGQ